MPVLTAHDYFAPGCFLEHRTLEDPLWYIPDFRNTRRPRGQKVRRLESRRLNSSPLRRQTVVHHRFFLPSYNLRPHIVLKTEESLVDPLDPTAPMELADVRPPVLYVHNIFLNQSFQCKIQSVYVLHKLV